MNKEKLTLSIDCNLSIGWKVERGSESLNPLAKSQGKPFCRASVIKSTAVKSIHNPYSE